MATETTTAELPRELYVLLYHDPRYGGATPLWLPAEGAGFLFPVFVEREDAKAFALSPKCDIPCAIHKITLEDFVRAGEYPIDVVREHEEEGVEYFYMIDPLPLHEWQSDEDMGFVVPMAAVAKALREEHGASLG